MAINLVFGSQYGMLSVKNNEVFGGPLPKQQLSANISDSFSAATSLIEEKIFVDYPAPASDSLNPKNLATYSKSSTKTASNYFAPPTIGWNWGVLHEENAVDIANRCGTPIYASNEGIIIPDKRLGSGEEGWNDGYGLFVLIEHPNNTKTRYAHLEKITSELGRYIKKGELIGYMGNTGNTHGPTGCHLHFEVIGAENPLAKQ